GSWNKRGFKQEGYWIKKNGEVLSSGQRNEYPDMAFLDISDDEGKGVTVGIRFAAGWWPKSLSANADGTVEVGLWPEENEAGYWIRYGSHNTFEVMYDFHARETDPLESMKKFQYPLVAKAPVEWYQQCVTGIYPLNHFVSFADEEEYMEDHGWDYAANKKNRKARMKVWRYHYWGLGGFINQHDFARIALVNFLRATKDFKKSGEYFLYADARFNYNADWAIFHSDDYHLKKINRKISPSRNRKRVQLAKVVFEDEHMHWYGLPLYYYLTGDERIKEAVLDLGEVIKSKANKKWITVYQRYFGWEMYSLAAMYDFTKDPSFMKLADQIFSRLLTLKFNRKKPVRNIYIDWNRGFVTRNRRVKPGLMTGYIIFDGLYNYYLNMDDNNSLKERVADVLEGISDFMYREPYVEGIKKSHKGEHRAFWLPYIYHVDDKSKSKQGYRLILQAFYSNLAPYSLNGESKWLERMDKIIRSAAWDRGGMWEGFTYLDHPGLQSILYNRIHPRKDSNPPFPISDLSAVAKGKKVILKWTVPADAMRYQIKFSNKKLVESLEF
ncbi:MAG: hypothetical protein KAJ10_14165, partial [Thermodesulfovibrionia bacterium]|nr:hypothetical protein [Thermodesulfovibrionia bacterium]